MALQGTENAYEDPNLADDEQEEFSESFVCCVCLDLLYKPIVLSCGHISCFWCVHQSMSPLCESHCPICRRPYYHFPTICWMLHFLLQKMYPAAYKRREIQTLEEEKKRGTFSPQIDGDNLASDVKFDHPGTSSPCYAGNLVSNPQNAGLSASMEQSGSETQKQNNGNICSKDVFGGTPEDFGTPAQVKMLPQTDRQEKISAADVVCSTCKQLLFHPVVLNCGHVYCESCIKNSTDEMLRCQICQLPHPRGFPKVCLELDHFIKEQFPEEYAKQRDAVQLRHINDKPETPSCSLNEGGGGKAAWWSDPHSKVHVGVGCDFCGMFPIVGDRYRCKDCKEKVGFDLCADCYKIRSKIPGRFNQQHTPDHEFELNSVNMIHSIITLVTGRLGHGSTENLLMEGLGFRPEDPNLVVDADEEHAQNDSEGTN
ncbi:E3 ubiquitin-protein ligase PRT1 isoform X1 [Neltuma alba]|nr:E3 ubiquitin-protein ligase PRT1-like isoform X1 [Prosopis alba]XP_028780960.1 E3 ubiquitin-protein ligase PRT1-like isoform X1 [Prosopis alba]XP_028780961.1 E3 ubiquitin-protein ligase PRT1-like isoform X1 [Prosopis alba]